VAGLVTTFLTSNCCSFHLSQDQIVSPSRHTNRNKTPITSARQVAAVSKCRNGEILGRTSTGRPGNVAVRLFANDNAKTNRGNSNAITATAAVDENDYLVLDSLQLPDEDRPSLVEALKNPRDLLALLLIVPVAGSVSVCNLFGIYDTGLYTDLVVASVGLGFLSGLASLLQVVAGYKVTNHSRRFLANDSAVNGYAGLYALAVSWLALRASNICPEWLPSSDGVLPWACLGVFGLSAIVPAITIFDPGNFLKDTPPLSETELVRMRGLLGIGILASVFAPDCLAFALGGSDWWDRVSTLHPSQTTLESTTTLFALYANEVSMLSHRCAREGVAPFRVVVPALAAMCLVLAILPCLAALYWLGNDVSFFSFYRE